jgi:catechol 2,3-dioxygenase-like lactoylglutathione lyase family enzyme
MHHLTGLDHPVIGVRDLDAARAQFERLGFIVPPRGSHPEWGTGNWCIQFPENYLEIRGLLRPSEAPQTRELQEFLRVREGLMGIAFGTEGARRSHEALVAAGLHPRPVKPLTRDFELPEGTVPVSFELCFLPREETPGLQHVVVCEHLTPERLRRPEWLRHANGTTGVTGLVAVAAEPERVLRAWERLFAPIEALTDGWRARVGGETIDLLGPAAAAVRYPASVLPAARDWPCLAAVVLTVADIGETRAFLRNSGAAVAAGSRVAADPRLASGCLIEFVSESSAP